MLTMIAMSFLCAGEGSNVVWMNAHEVDDRPLVVAEAGKYRVWAWVDRREAAKVSIGDESLKIKADKGSKGFKWVEAGTVRFDVPSASVGLEGPIAAIVVTGSRAFDPETAMGLTRVLDEPVAVDDVRMTLKRDTNTLFGMTPFESREEWEVFADGLRRRILVSSGLLPLPERTPLNAVVEPVAKHDDYVVEKVRLEPYPGFYMTGNLYRPVGDGPYPGIITPHGHWGDGRVVNEERGCVAARCITFARMGMVAFSYDMVGYVDSLQFDHNFGWREKDADPAARAALELWGIHPFAVQTWSSIRALDFMEDLPFVDGDRLACTGASGGGTQTFIVTAIDPRVKVAAPVNMISHSMQGGCICENAPILRLNASNMEIGALTAPRPLLMVSASGDWTTKTPEVEYPAIRSVFELYDAEQRVASSPFDAPHNYNLDSRQAVYRFFGKWILHEPEKYAEFTEPAFEMEPVEALRVFPDGKLPENALSSEQILANLTAAIQAKWNAVLPGSADEAKAFRSEYGPALADALGASVPENVTARLLGRGVDDPSFAVDRLILSREGAGDAVPALVYQPRDGSEVHRVAVVVHEQGKAALADLEHSAPGPLVRGLLDKGMAVVAIDPFLTGEHHAPGKRARRIKKNFPDTFVPTTTACRVQDVLTAAAFAKKSAWSTGNVVVAGVGDAGLWCLLAAALDDDMGRVLVDANGFDPDDDTAWVARHQVPCIRGIGDVATAAALIAPRPATLHNTSAVAGWQRVTEAYTAAGGTKGAVADAALDPVAQVAFLAE
ncbi:MAG: hypothetical protein GY851_05905 [bacterium]|nr:hypothetical protein [bacterium]